MGERVGREASLVGVHLKNFFAQPPAALRETDPHLALITRIALSFQIAHRLELL